MCKNKGTYCFNSHENANGYCNYCVKEGYAGAKPVEAAPKPIAKESKKRAKDNRIDQKQNKELKEKEPYCQIKSPVCTGWAQGAQHLRGRLGKNLTDIKNKISACNACNGWCESHPLEAKKMGVAKSRLHE